MASSPAIPVGEHRALGSLRFRIAVTEELQRIRDLRMLVYRADWPAVPIDYINDAQDSMAHHLVAISDDTETFVGATRILPPSVRPFETERFVDLSGFLDPGRTPAEIGRLCLHHDWRRVQTPLVNAGLLALAVRFAQKHNVTDLILGALPRLVSLYRTGLFEAVNLAYEHPIWGEVKIMRLDLLTLPLRLKNSKQPFARLLLDPTVANIIV